MLTRTRAHFDQEIHALQNQMLEMATCADWMLSAAVDAMMSGDADAIRSVVLRDNVVDDFDVEIENKCLSLIATQQPVARDLRIIGTALKVITDIERIGDYAVDIAKIGRRMVRAHELYRPLVDLPLLARLTRDMLHDALQAFVNHDSELVKKVISDDDAVDKLYHQMRDDLTIHILSAGPHKYAALSSLFAAKYLERASDHVVNIAERVNFIETGELRQLNATASASAFHEALI